MVNVSHDRQDKFGSISSTLRHMCLSSEMSSQWVSELKLMTWMIEVWTSFKSLFGKILGFGGFISSSIFPILYFTNLYI